MTALRPDLPRVFVSQRRVYIAWPQSPYGLCTCVISLGTYLDDVLGWTQRMPDGLVELVPAEPAEGERP
jgi:hypothetical protein